MTSPVWDELARTRRVVMYDPRGTGRSTAVKPGTPLTLADQLADLEAVKKSNTFFEEPERFKRVVEEFLSRP